MWADASHPSDMPRNNVVVFVSTNNNSVCLNTRPNPVQMLLLHYLSYVAAVAAFVFVTLSLASGLLYVSELIEEHFRHAKLVGQRAIYAIIALHVLLYVTDSLPLFQTIFSILAHLVYLQNFSNQWPLISLSSASFVASCAMAIMNHFLWFMHFSRLARTTRPTYNRHRVSVSNAPGFTDIATFFGICVWLVPLFLFLSLSANDNALPTSSGPSSIGAQRPKSSLFKSMFAVFSKDKTPPLDKSNALITPPPQASIPAYPLPSLSIPPPRSPLLSPPHSPTHKPCPTADPPHTYCPSQMLSRNVASDDAILSSRRVPRSVRNMSVDD